MAKYTTNLELEYKHPDRIGIRRYASTTQTKLVASPLNFPETRTPRIYKAIDQTFQSRPAIDM